MVYLQLVKSFFVWLVFVVCEVVLSLLAYPLSPIISFCSLVFPETKYPKLYSFWFWIWLTHDNTMDGDEGHIKRWPLCDNWIITFLRRTAWMWRNKAYNASYWWFGRVITGKLHQKGNHCVGNRPLVRGWSFEYDDKGTWEFYVVQPVSFSKKKAFRIRLGWKIPDYHDKPIEGVRVMHVFTGSPWMSYEDTTGKF